MDLCYRPPTFQVTSPNITPNCIPEVQRSTSTSDMWSSLTWLPAVFLEFSPGEIHVWQKPEHLFCSLQFLCNLCCQRKWLDYTARRWGAKLWWENQLRTIEESGCLLWSWASVHESANLCDQKTIDLGRFGCECRIEVNMCRVKLVHLCVKSQMWSASKIAPWSSKSFQNLC